MLRDLLSDRRGRTAYVLTKVAVLAAAATATWPLSRVLGVRAWYGLAAFALTLAGVTVAVLLASLAPRPAAAPDSSVDEGAEDEDAPGPEDAVALPLEDSLDLHSFPPRDVPEVVAAYLEEAHAAGLREVRLIHGRGIGVQRERVHSLLARHPLVEAYRDAPPERGGWGATVAYLIRAEDEA